jgi:transcriptional regulator with XRE-family HTH domain
MKADASEIDAHVGSRIRSRREGLGMSQARLGSRLGLTFSQVQKYEKGSNRIGAGRLLLVAEALEVSVQYFFEGLNRTDMTAESTRDADPSPPIDKPAPDSVADALKAIRCRETRETLTALVLSLANATEKGDERQRGAG